MKKFVVVDLETTGHSPKRGDRIIQFAAVTIEDGVITNKYTTYINPEIPIPPFISELTGIRDEDVSDAPIFYEVAEEIFQLLDGHVFVAHNAHFDWNFLQEEFHVNGFPNVKCPLIDTVELTRILMPTLESFRLQDIAEYAGFEHDRPHQADSDALVTARWFLTLLEKAASLPDLTLKKLYRLSTGLKTDVAMIFQELADQKKPLFDTWVEYKGVIIRNPEQLDREVEIEVGLSDDDLSKRFQEFLSEDYELQEMVQEVYTAFEEREFSLIETDPRLQKKAGYIIPALFFSWRKKKPVVISTRSTEQQLLLVEQDIPELARRFNIRVKVRLLKGRSHYLDLEKFIAILQDDEEHYDETMTKMQILVWLLETTTGDKSELNLSSGGELFWKRINAGVQGGNGKKTALDFYERALFQARDAHIIVTNHHFLMYHLTKKEGGLPNFEYLVIDEAHQFERSVARYFGNEISYQQLKFLLGRVGSRQQPRLFQQLIALRKKHQLYFPMTSAELERLLDDFSNHVDEFFQLAYSLMERADQYNLLCDFTTYSRLGYSWERLYGSFRDLFSALEKIYFQIAEHFMILSAKEKVLLDDLALLLQEFHTIAKIHRDLSSQEPVVWLESNRQSITTVRLFSEPVFIGQYLKDFLYSRFKSIIFVSNTLTIKNSFSYIEEQLGLSNYPIVKKQFKTSRNLDNTHVFSMTDIPDLKDVPGEDFIQAIGQHIATIADAVNGRILVLFTSREMLQKTWQELKDETSLNDYVFLAQGVSAGSPRRLLKQFTRHQKVLLFGSNAFWDGLNLQEADLDALIIVRLPFLPPNHPVHKGKTKQLKQNGKNPFYHYSVPVAVLRFKHGINHLLS